MGRETVLFRSKERKSRGEVSEFLRQLADKIGDGQVKLRQGSEDITLQMPTGLILEIKVEDEEKRKKGVQHSLEVELKWFDNDSESGPLELG